MNKPKPIVPIPTRVPALPDVYHEKRQQALSWLGDNWLLREPVKRRTR
jgi:hypothetical protein